MKNYFSFLLVFLFVHAEKVFAQVCTGYIQPNYTNSNVCGIINPEPAFCDSNIICIGDSIKITSSTTDIVDTTFVCWNDGSPLEIIPGNLTTCLTHLFNCDEDFCAPFYPYQHPIDMWVLKYCSGGASYSFKRATVYVDIKFKPHAYFNIVDDTFCVDDLITIAGCNLSCANSPTATYLWNFNSQGTSNLSCVNTYSFATPGMKIISFTITNECGTSTHKDTVYILPPTVVSATITLPNNCAPVCFVPVCNWSFVDTVNSAGFHWSPNSAPVSITPPNGNPNPTICISTGGTYYITLNVDGCCASPQSICTWTDTVTLSSGPVISTTTPASGCIDSMQIDPNNFFTITNTTGGTTYHWDYTNASSNSQNGLNVLPVWFYQGTNKIVLTVTQPGCGPKKDSVTWIYYPTPIADAGNDTTICEGQTVVLTGSVISGSHPTDSYLWTAAGCITTTCSVAPNATTTYVFHVTNAGGCTDADSVVVTVLPSPTFTITPSTVNICEGDTSQMIIASPNYVYVWSPPGGLTYQNANHSHVFAHPANSQTYTATTSALGCSYTQTLIVNVIPIPQLSVSPDTNVTVCQGSTLVLNASGASTYLWTPNTNIFPTNSNVVTITGVSDMTYTLIGSNGNGCEDTIQVHVHVDSSSITLTATPDTICIGQSTTLHVLGGTAPYSYSCTSAPCPAGGANPVVAPTITTTYTATANAGAGCSSSANVVVHVNLLPIISVSASNPTPCQGDVVTLTASGATTYSWSPSINLSQTTGASVSVNPVPANNISYTVIGTDGNNCSASGSVSLTVFPLPIVNAGGDGIFCDDIFSVNLLSLGAATSGHWSGPFTNDALATFYPDSAGYGTYTIVLTHTDLNGCTNTDTIVITVDSSANSFAGNDFSICLDAPSVSLNGTPTSGIFYGVGVDSSGGIYSFNPSIALTGTHIIHFNPSASCYYTDDLVVTVYPLPVPTITVADDDTLVCTGQPVVMVANGGTQYTWSPTTFLNETDTSTVIATPTINTTYTVAVTDVNGCTATTTQALTIVPNPIANFEVLDNSLCNGNEFQFFNQSLNANYYLWDFHDSTATSTDTTKNPLHLFPDSGIYNITLTAYTNDFCFDDTTQSGFIRVLPVPSANISAVQNIHGDSCSYKFHFQLLNAFAIDSIIWNLGDGAISNELNFEHEYADDAAIDSITISLINEFGCATEITVALNINQCHYLFIPNTFSPNGNGTNETFGVLGVGIDSVEMYVYDRWGSRMFHTSDLSEQWDGMMNGKPMGTGVYVYEVWVLFNDGTEKYLKGDVTLLR